MKNWIAILSTISSKANKTIINAMANAMPQVIQEFKIDNDLKIAHFLAQIAHETDGFKALEEYASGKAYEDRRDLGNSQHGDGVRYKGRGAIMLTGRKNYRSASSYLNLPLLEKPELAAQMPHALRIAGWFFETNNLFKLAEKDDVGNITKIINGGSNGLESRIEFLKRAKEALKSPIETPDKTMLSSKTGWSSVLLGASGVLVGVDGAVKDASVAIDNINKNISVATDAVDLWHDFSSIFAVFSSLSPWVILIAISFFSAAFIWFDRRQKMKILGV